MLKKPLITVVFGTRPEAIKLSPLIQQLKQEKFLRIRVILTGQHSEMVAQVLSLFKIKEDDNLKIMKENQTLTHITTQILEKLKIEFTNYKPDLVLVQGDTTSAMASSLAAFYEKIPIGHVEAGLRTNSIINPFPEEANRRLISQLSTIHFAPSKKAFDNLKKDNVSGKIFLTGNTVIDALLYISNNPFKTYLSDIDLKNQRIILATVHRRENWGKNIENICHALVKILENNSRVFLIMPLHKNKLISEPIKKILFNHPRVKLTNPLSYEKLVEIIKRSTLVLTDSGGIQEEAPSLGKPVLVLRETTERVEALENGTTKLVGTDIDNIFENANLLLNNEVEYNSMAKSINPYGDGTSSKKIIDACKNFLKL